MYFVINLLIDLAAYKLTTKWATKWLTHFFTAPELDKAYFFYGIDREAELRAALTTCFFEFGSPSKQMKRAQRQHWALGDALQF
jgi:hypothetical protein